MLYNFCSQANRADGGGACAALVEDAQGNLYGTTEGGGNQECEGDGGSCGTVFKLGNSGNETVLHAFTNGADGGLPARGPR